MCKLIVGLLLIAGTGACRDEQFQGAAPFAPVKFADASGILKIQDIQRCPHGHGVWRTAAQFRDRGIRLTDTLDWDKHDVVFISAFHPVHSGVFKEFRIFEVVSRSGQILVKARAVYNPNNAKGGPSLDFHAVLIPSTDLPVAFEVNGELEPPTAR